MLVEVGARSGEFVAAPVQSRLEKIAGVSRATLKEEFQNGAVFEVEASKGQLVRGDLARAIVEAGWDLNELRPAAMSLEEIFLQLTGADAGKKAAPSPEASESTDAPASEANA